MNKPLIVVNFKTYASASGQTAEDLALEVLLQVEMNNISIADFKVAIANAIGMIEENNEVVPFEMVG